MRMYWLPFIGRLLDFSSLLSVPANVIFWHLTHMILIHRWIDLHLSVTLAPEGPSPTVWVEDLGKCNRSGNLTVRCYSSLDAS